MSLHHSLKSGSGIVKHRNVLTKRERILKLLETGKWSEEDAHALGIPKVRNIKITSKKSGEKKKEEAVEAAAEGMAPEGAAAPDAEATPTTAE